MKPADVRGLYEEISNSVTHAIALGLAIGATAHAIAIAESTGSVNAIRSAQIYGASMITLFISSTLYHGFQVQPYKHYFRIFDHSTIYIMIAGSVTPFLYCFIREPNELIWVMVIWLLTVLGITYKIFFFGRSEVESVSSYFILTGIGFFCAIPKFDLYPYAGQIWIVLGLVVYVAGVYFYVKDQKPFFHTVWHIFVFLGASCHYIAITQYVLPAAL